MGEQPKPITRLAVPIDSLGPRQRNRAGEIALLWAGLQMLVGFAVLACRELGVDQRQQMPGMSLLRLVVCAGVMLAVVAFGLGLWALRRARLFHLERESGNWAAWLSVLSVFQWLFACWGVFWG